MSRELSRVRRVRGVRRCLQSPIHAMACRAPTVSRLRRPAVIRDDGAAAVQMAGRDA
jgi:hypothetical protein